MRKSIRLGLVTAVALAALTFAAQAFAAYTPKLTVSMGATGTNIHLAIPPADDPTALLVFLAPAGTKANLSATSGTVGTLTAQAAAAALGGATLPLTGTVEARAANGTYGSGTPLATAATVCTGTATHAAFWVMRLTAAGQVLEVPIYVDPVTGALAAAAAYSLAICLPPSDIPENLGGAAFGAKVFDANFTVKDIFTATSGTNVWRLRGTPYNLGKGTPNVAATVEAQSYVESGSVALGAVTRALTKMAATFSLAGKTSAGASVTLAKGTSATALSPFARPTVGASGAFASKLTVRRGPKAQKLYVRATAAAPARDLEASMCKATFGFPCISATASGFAATSATKMLIVPAKGK